MNIILRPITIADTENIVKWRNSWAVRQYFIDQNLITPSSHKKWLENYVYTKKVAQFIINLDGKDIGSVFLRDIDREKGTAEFGIFICEDFQGMGAGKLTIKMILDVGYNELKLQKISLRVKEDNVRAINSYEKSGFYIVEKKDGVVFMQHQKADNVL